MAHYSHNPTTNSGSLWFSNNVAVGYYALYSNQPIGTSTGNGNTAVGTFAMSSNYYGFNNTAIGYYSDVSANFSIPLPLGLIQ